MNVESESLAGKLMKVLSVDDASGRVYVRILDGRTGWFTAPESLPAKGDVFLVDENGQPQLAEKSLWPEHKAIAVVRHVDDDGSILLDNGLSIITAANGLKIELKANNTVEYSETDGVLRLISTTPIRSRDFGLDEAEILNEYLVKPGSEPLTFEDFGGYPAVVSQARELIDTQFRFRKNLEAIGAKPLKGILLTGPPGTGKTHLARIIAQESEADFFLISGPSVVSKWVGDTESTLRRLFQAATASPAGRAIIFFDEIDSLAERRTATSHDYSNRLVAQLLTLLDGFDTAGKSVLVVAATNRIDSLDPALTRPGRFDWEIEFGAPDLQDRLDILSVGARRLKTTGDLPLPDIAVLSVGWSAAKLTSLWSEAAHIAARDRRSEISSEDVALAYERMAKRPDRAALSGDAT